MLDESAKDRLVAFNDQLLVAYEDRNSSVFSETATRLESFAQMMPSALAPSVRARVHLIAWTARGLREQAGNGDPDWDRIGADLSFLKSFIEQLEAVLRGADPIAGTAQEWFGQRGLAVVVEQRDDGFWASLYRRSDRVKVVFPDYGRGSTPEEAEQHARQRCEAEQGATVHV